MDLDQIKEGMFVVGKDDYYEGLVGVITEVRHDKADFETENETELEIVVDFVETSDMERTHPFLNGTSVEMLIMGEDELYYFPNGLDEAGFDLENNMCMLKDVIVKTTGYEQLVKEQL